MTNAYQLSQAIHVAATFAIADLVHDRPRRVDDLAQVTGTRAPVLYRLLRALASIGIFVEGKDGRFAQTPLSEYLRSDVPGSVRAWAMYVGRPYHWSTWAHLVDTIRTGEPAFPKIHGASVWEYRASRPEEAATFDAAMSGLSAAVAGAVVRGYDFAGIGTLVDVGGGEGELLAAILAANPSLRGILFDLPYVVTGAPRVLEEAGVADRCRVVGGSVFEAVPEGADAYLLKAVLHDWDDAEAMQILRNCRTAMRDGGRLLVVERLVRPANEPDPVKFADLMMLVMLGGRERTADDFRRLCAAAGFRLTEIVPTDSAYSILEGEPA
jgi:hypothetical protein